MSSILLYNFDKDFRITKIMCQYVLRFHLNSLFTSKVNGFYNYWAIFQVYAHCMRGATTCTEFIGNNK